MRAILDVVSPAATLVEALEPIRSDPARAAVLLDIDGTLAPIVRHAADAHVPEATRTLLIEIAKRYRLVGCVSGRRAATARQIVAIGTIAYVGNHGGELLRPAGDQPRGRPRARGVDRARARLRRARAYTRRASAPARAQRGQGRDRRVPLARRARRGGGRGGACGEIAELAEEEGFAVHWGRKVLEVRPPVALDKGLGIATLLRGVPVDAALYVGDDTTDLDAFRGLRALVAVRARSSAPCASPCAPTKRRPSWRARPT